MGYTHLDAGRILADKWQLSDELKAAVVNHHTPYEERQFPVLTSAAHIGNIWSHSLYFGGGAGRIPTVDSKAMKRLGINIDDIEPIMAESDALFEKIVPIFLPPVPGQQHPLGKNN